MAKFSGLFELKTPAALYQKLEHDFARLGDEPLNQFVAFDFFVTAEHMLDWLFPGDGNEAKRKAKRQSDVLLRICSHLANGSKHFQATNKRHDVVKGTERHHGSFSQGFSSGFDIDRLIIRLDGDAIALYGDPIEVTQLAEKVLKYWKTEIGI